MTAYYNDARKMGYEIANFTDKGSVFQMVMYTFSSNKYREVPHPLHMQFNI
jgi:hypothetical protein